MKTKEFFLTGCDFVFLLTEIKNKNEALQKKLKQNWNSIVYLQIK